MHSTPLPYLVAITRVAITRVAITRVAIARVAIARVAITSAAITRVAITRVGNTSLYYQIIAEKLDVREILSFFQNVMSRILCP